MLYSSLDTQIAAPFLKQLSPDVRKCLLSQANNRRFEQGETICIQDEECNSLKIVLTGWVKLYRVTQSGHEALLDMLTDGQSFDEVQALKRGKNLSYVEAATDCEVLFIDLSAACSCKAASGEISSAILSAAADHLDDMMLQVEELKVFTGVERLTNFLIRLFDRQDDSSQVYLPFDKVVLAAALGMKPESLSRAFSKLRNLGVTCNQKSVIVQDMDRLREIVH